LKFPGELISVHLICRERLAAEEDPSHGRDVATLIQCACAAIHTPVAPSGLLAGADADAAFETDLDGRSLR
jgi:hypothetical protein